MDVGPCLGCGFDDPNFVVKNYVSGKDGLLSCDICRSVKGTVHRDAAGNVLSVPNSLLGKYSPALGKVVESARDFSETCKRKGLVQTGQVLGDK